MIIYDFFFNASMMAVGGWLVYLGHGAIGGIVIGVVIGCVGMRVLQAN